MSSTNKIYWQELAGIGVLGLLSFLLFLGKAPLFDWDEINFAESAREMIASGDYFRVQIDFQPFEEKPPLFFWLQTLSMKAFGVNAFAARLPNALIGACTLMALLWFGAKLRRRRFGFLLAGFYLGSILSYLYFKSGIIDPVFNFFIFMGLMQLILYELNSGARRSKRRGLYAGLWIGLATLTKGPVALLVVLLIYGLYKAIFDRFRIPWLEAMKFLGAWLGIVLAWFGSMILFTEEGMELTQKFIAYQTDLFSSDVAGHGQPFYYHLVVFILGCFPMSVFTFRGMGVRMEDANARLLKQFMVIWFLVVLILFSIVTTKIIHYSSLLYFPGAFLAVFYLERLEQQRKGLPPDSWLIFGLGTLVFALIPTGINFLTANLEKIARSVDEPFTRANLLAPVEWSGWEWIPGALFLIGLIFGLRMLLQKRFQRFILTMAVLTPIYLNLLNAILVPKIAGYTQQAATDFFAAHADEDVYLAVSGYKSYAHFFYGKVKPFGHPEVPRDDKQAWLARGPIDKPVLLVTRLDRIDEVFYQSYPEFYKVGEQAGFVFFRRDPPDTQNSSTTP